MTGLITKRIAVGTGRIVAAVILKGAVSVANDWVRERDKKLYMGIKEDSTQIANLVKNQRAGIEPDEYDLI